MIWIFCFRAEHYWFSESQFKVNDNLHSLPAGLGFFLIVLLPELAVPFCSAVGICFVSGNSWKRHPWTVSRFWLLCFWLNNPFKPKCFSKVSFPKLRCPGIQKDAFRVYYLIRKSSAPHRSAFLFLWQTGLEISGWEGNNFLHFILITDTPGW